MAVVIVVDLSGDVPERGLCVRQRIYANIITLEGFDECLGDAVRFRAARQREAIRRCFPSALVGQFRFIADGCRCPLRVNERTRSRGRGAGFEVGG
jgi:hypothetical protein